MATTKSDNMFSHESRRSTNAINTYGNSQAEWWLNVNYAEEIDMRDAVNAKLHKARLAS